MLRYVGLTLATILAGSLAATAQEQSIRTGRGVNTTGRLVPLQLRDKPPEAAALKQKMERANPALPPLRVKPGTVVPPPKVPPTPVGPSAAAPLPQGGTILQNLPTARQSPDKPEPRDKSFSFTIFRSNLLTPPNIDSFAETSAGNAGATVFMTGNLFAAFSTDGGRNFFFIDPANQAFLPQIDGGFDGDQTAIYDRSRDLMAWQLLYDFSDATQKGSFRTLFAHPAAIATNGWCVFEWNPETFKLGSGLWLDYPDVALSDNFIWYTANVFDNSATPQVKWSIIWRIPLDSVSTGCASMTFEFYADNFRRAYTPTQGATSTMYWLTHDSTSDVTIYRWDENADPDSVSNHDVGVTGWTDTDAAANPANCPGPDGVNWCAKSDGFHGRAAWVDGARIGFMWNAKQDGGHPFPYVRVAIFNQGGSQPLMSEPDIWNPTTAFHYPAIAVNDRGHLGGSVYQGGGFLFPTMMALIWDDQVPAPPPWELHPVATSAKGATRWGDYYSARRHGTNGFTWITTGQAIRADGKVQAVYAWFGRDLDVPSLIVEPDANMTFVAPVGGPFTTDVFSYTLKASGGSLNNPGVNFSIAALPDWLSVSPASGKATPSGTKITFSVNANANALKEGTYGLPPSAGFWLPIIFFNNDSGRGVTSRTATLTLDPGMQVTPATDMIAFGPQGGPFSPSSFSYTLKSSGGTVNYLVTPAKNWVTLSSPDGTATPGSPLSGTVDSTGKTITLKLNQHAGSLAPGNYGPIYNSISNTTNGHGNTSRAYYLNVGPPALEVTPPTNRNVTGPAGGPFSPSSITFALKASAGTLNYTISGVPSWLTPSWTSGTVDSSGKHCDPVTHQCWTQGVTFTPNANANAKAAGFFDITNIDFINATNGQGNISGTVSLAVQGALQVTPATGQTIVGPAGGPFAPASFSYTLKSSGGTVNYLIAGVPNWLTASSSSGTVDSSGKTITFTVNANANAKPAGTSKSSLVFLNTISGLGNSVETVSLTAK